MEGFQIRFITDTGMSVSNIIYICILVPMRSGQPISQLVGMLSKEVNCVVGVLQGSQLFFLEKRDNIECN